MTSTTVVALALALATTQEPAQPPTPLIYHPPGWAQSLLESLCHSRQGEPACDADADLSEDEAWLVLREACTTDNSEPCRTFRTGQGGVLIYDVRHDRWRAEWESRLHELKFDVAGVPTLRLKPKHSKDLKVIAVDISPLSYSATPGTPTEADLTIVAGLKTFLALAGTGIQGLIQTLSFATPQGPPSAAPAPPSPAPAAGGKVAPMIKGQPAPPPPPECTIRPPEVNGIAAQITSRLAALVDLQEKMRALEIQLERLERSRTAFITAAQAAEDGKDVALADLARPETAVLTTAYETFESAAETLGATTSELASCGPLMSAYGLLIGAPANVSVIVEFAQRVPLIQGCRVSPIRTALVEDAQRMERQALDPTCATKIKDLVELHRDALKLPVERLLNAKAMEEKVWQAIDKAKAAKKDVLAGAGVLDRRVREGRRHTWKGKLTRALIVTRPNPELSWSKVQSHSIIFKADTPYVKELTLAHGTEETRSYKIASATGDLLGYGIGMVYTPLQDSTWTAVTVPGTETKVITETKRESRAGDLVGFLSYRFMEHRPKNRSWQPTLDFGVGLTSDRPAFFAGLGAEIGRAARLGFGWTAQRITRLTAGQTENVTVVSSTDDIKTQKRFDASRYYISLTFALDALSLFNEP